MSTSNRIEAWGAAGKGGKRDLEGEGEREGGDSDSGKGVADLKSQQQEHNVFVTVTTSEPIIWTASLSWEEAVH
jgi:hypothetical protein